MLIDENVFIADVEQWLKDDDDDVYTRDLVKCSGKSHSIKSGRTTASAGIKVGERAKLGARAAVSMEKHALEAQEERLRKRKDLLQMEA